jgi:hypothetical protein
LEACATFATESALGVDAESILTDAPHRAALVYIFAVIPDLLIPFWANAHERPDKILA